MSLWRIYTSGASFLQNTCNGGEDDLNVKQYRKVKQSAEVKVYSKLMKNIFTKQTKTDDVSFFFQMTYAKQVTVQKYTTIVKSFSKI